MKNIKFLLTFMIKLSLLLIFMINPVYAQYSPFHNVGKLSYIETKDAGKNAFEYPNGTYLMGISTALSENAVFLQYYPETGPIQTEYFFSARGARKEFIKDIWRWSPPTITVNDVVVSRPFYGEVDNKLVSDMMSDIKYSGRMGSRRKTYVYTNRNHDDYMIVDMTLSFQGDTDMIVDTDIRAQTVQMAWEFAIRPRNSYLSLLRWTSRGDWEEQRYGWCTWDWFSDVMGRPILVKNGKRSNLKISYYYTVHNNAYKAPPGYSLNEVSHLYDNFGWPDVKKGSTGKGMFISTAYVGIVTLHADKATNDTNDDPSLPNSCGWISMGNWNLPGGYWKACAGAYNPKAQWELTGRDPTSIMEEEDAGYQMFQSFGPYTMSIDSPLVRPPDDVRAVYAIGAGSIDEGLCNEYGRKWYNWYWDLNVPAGQKMNNEEKNALVSTGRDSLFQAMDRAYWTYNRGLNIPDPPPAPDLDVKSGPGTIELKWSYPNPDMYKDPDTGADDFYKWRLYRKLGAFYVYDDKDQGDYYTYELIGEFDKGTTSYIDKVNPGTEYHYCVTGIDDGSQNKDGLFPGQKLEGSYYLNRVVQAARASEPGLNVSDQVRVVPNPYSISSGLSNKMNWKGATNDIHFVRLPAYCIIKIYTITGDLIQTIKHVSGSGDEVWENLRTISNQYPASGVYVAVIDDAKDAEQKHLPKQMIKFVIVR